MIRRPRITTLFPYTTLFRSGHRIVGDDDEAGVRPLPHLVQHAAEAVDIGVVQRRVDLVQHADRGGVSQEDGEEDRKSTRLNSSHSQISYAVFCLKKKKKPRL